jgi:phospholipid/cholesterol/gamma-HCH transport system substrate-binding protein
MNNHLKSGLFVLSALIAFVSVTIWLSGRQGGEATASYSLFFQKDVSGLMLGGPVFYLGVEVGNVTRMEIIPGDPMSVRVDVEVLESTPIDTGTSGSLAYQGITGVAVINLTGDPGMNLPLKTPPGMDYPVIEVRDTGLAALLSDAPQVMDKVNGLLDKVAELASEENQARVAGTLQNIESLTGALKSEGASIAELPASLNQTLSEVRQMLAELRGITTALRPGLSSTVANIEEMSNRLASLTVRLDTWAGENSEDMGNFLDGGLGQVPELVSDARETLRELQKLVRELRENPSSLVYEKTDDPVAIDR